MHGHAGEEVSSATFRCCSGEITVISMVIWRPRSMFCGSRMLACKTEKRAEHQYGSLFRRSQGSIFGSAEENITNNPTCTSYNKFVQNVLMVCTTGTCTYKYEDLHAWRY